MRHSFSPAQPPGDPAPAARADSSGLERFCVALCHDLRTPIATAGIAIDRLASLEASPLGAQRQYTRASRHPDLISIARESLVKAEELLSSLPGLLAAERAGRLEAISLLDVALQARDDVRSELQLSGGRIAIDARMPAVLAQRERLRIALRNLLQNAIRYRRRDVALRIRLTARTDGDWRELRVSDNGPGIARGDRMRLFTPLERSAAAPASGGGLGLAIARRAVEACGGSLAIRSRAGRGATFSIRLRAAETDA